MASRPSAAIDVIDLSPRHRVVFAAVWIAVQATLVLTAYRRADHAFGFQMFNESSTLSVHLSRALVEPSSIAPAPPPLGNPAQEGQESLVPVSFGQWDARGRDGAMHHFFWTARVKDPVLVVFDHTMHASFGIAAQLARWQAALDDVATHTGDDVETRAFVADVTVTKNGRAPYRVRLISVAR